VKDQFFARFPNLVLTDAIGASESGTNGITVVQPGNTAMKGGPTVQPVVDTVVLDETGNTVVPGSGVIGKVARRGNIPLRYLKDEQKTAETFVEVGGVPPSRPTAPSPCSAAARSPSTRGARRSSPRRSKRPSSRIRPCTT
jgi:acyl-CoA synthetase (AMP-forming)/AMP-acid ligase II